MTQYFFIDESGDLGLQGQESASSYFVLAMVQLPNRSPLRPLTELRKVLSLPLGFEFKYHKTTTRQKELFFSNVLDLPFRVRALVLDKKTGWVDVLFIAWRDS